MRRLISITAIAILFGTAPASAYVEAPHTLGRCVSDSTTIVLMEVTKVQKDKGLVIYKKIRDIKGKHPVEEIKHNIGQRGFHPREWQTVLALATPGAQAIFMYNNEASETCLGTYWYQCYREGEWWGMTHAEPYLLRTYYGEASKLADLVERIHKNEEVIAPCFADGNKDQLHQRKGKLQRLRASLKRLDYNAKRDFVGFGGDGDEVEFKTTELLPASSKDWKFIPASQLGNIGEGWIAPAFDDAKWRTGKAPIGYGEEEIGKRMGTTIAEVGVDFVFRRAFDVPAELLATKGATFRISLASDDGAKLMLNGQVIDQDIDQDHEFMYWNRDIEVTAQQLKAGRNVIAVLVKNKQASSDLYLDAEVVAEVPLPKKVKVVANPMPNPMPMSTAVAPVASNFVDGWNPDAMIIDKPNKRIIIQCRVAKRKLPNLDQQYPIEVIATYPAPRAQKAHETVLTFTGIRPSDVHRGLIELGLKPGRPAVGENAKAEGPELKIWVEFPGPGKAQAISLEQLLVHKTTGQPMIGLKWHFTGSALKQPDPELDDKVFGADMTGTLISLFPVTDATVIQSQLTMKDEPNFKLETNTKVLPKEGTPIRLIIALP